MSWTLVETIEKSFPLEDPVDRFQAVMIAGMVTGWFARVLMDAGLEEVDRDRLWDRMLDNLGIEGTGV